MKLAVSSVLRVMMLVSSALFILILTLIISLVTGHPAGLFLTRSIRGIVIRFVLVTLTLVVPIPILPSLLPRVANMAKNEGPFGQFVKSTSDAYQELGRVNAWVLRPLQGIGLSMIFAERLLGFLEFLPVRLVLFIIGSALVSLFLSIVWALDDLGARIYDRRTGEVHTVGSKVGMVLPLITGAFGIASLFHLSSPLDALTKLFEIIMVLYPPYVFFVIFHQEYIKRRITSLSKRLLLKRIEVNLRL